MIRRVVLIVLASLTLLAVTPAVAGAYPARVGVSAGEYWLTLSRLNVPKGLVKVEIVNYGEDPHDLKLRRIGGTRTYSIPETVSGGRNARTWRLRAGRYHVWCAAADHRAPRAPRRYFGRAAFSASSANTAPSGAVRYAGLFRCTRRK